MQRLRLKSTPLLPGLLLALALAGCDQGDSNDRPEVFIQDTLLGTGTLAEADKIVRIDYTGRLVSGVIFDTSRQEGREPLVFQLETGLLVGDPQGRVVIEGLIEGVPGMRVGGVRRLTIPPQLAYGNRGAGCLPENPDDCLIPPNATLLFDVELLDVLEPPEQPAP